MRKSNHTAIRQLLRENPDGMTARSISERVGVHNRSVREALLAMPDTYIDRWLVGNGPPAAVWCVVTPPENCPRPDRGCKERT